MHSKLLVFNGGDRRRHHLLHPRLHHRAGPGRDRDHGENQENPSRPLRPRHRDDPEDRRRRGSVTSFSLKIDKKFTYKGKKVSVLSAKCPDGKLQAHVTAKFVDGTRASADVIRTCTGKG